jgi:hypothetical protein
LSLLLPYTPLAVPVLVVLLSFPLLSLFLFSPPLFNPLV